MRIHNMLPLVLMLLFAALIASPRAGAQDKKITKKDVPAAVLSAFAKTYPNAKIKGTSTEVEKGKTYYEIESMDGAQARDILYLADGTASEIEEVVGPAALPDQVKTTVTKEFAKAKITKAEKVTKGTDVSYEIHVTAGSKKGSVVVSTSGAVLERNALKVKKEKKEKKEEEEKEEDD